MTFPVQMPALGESVTEGTVTKWLKQVGEFVAVDEPIVEVSTDKVDTEVVSPVSGRLARLVALEDSIVEIGGQLALVEVQEPFVTETQNLQNNGLTTVNNTVTPGPTERSQASKFNAAQTDAGITSLATPYVRKIASGRGIDLENIVGSGPGGRVLQVDLGTSESGQPRPREDELSSRNESAGPIAADMEPADAPREIRGSTIKASRIRRLTAEKTLASLQNSAQLTQTFEIDLSKISRVRDARKGWFLTTHGVKLTFLPFFVKASAEALMLHPNVNATYNDDHTITYHSSVHIGIAVDTDKGLVVPVIKDVQSLSLSGVAKAISNLADKSRSGTLSADQLSGGTFTVTNIGSQGALFDTPILVAPQAAILGTGSIVKRPVVAKDSAGADVISIRSMCFLPMTYDHRLVDGADAGRFLTTLKKRLEHVDFTAELEL